MSIDEQIESILTETRDRIRQNMEEKGINASGRTSLSFRVVKEGSKIMLMAGGNSQKWGGDTAPVETIEIGRGPGGDWKVLRPVLVRWIVQKETLQGWTVEGANDREKESHRWAIATNMAKRITSEGTRRYSMPEDVYSTPVNEAAAKVREVFAANMREFFSAIVEGRKVETFTNF